MIDCVYGRSSIYSAKALTLPLLRVVYADSMLDKARAHLRQKLAKANREEIPLLQAKHIYGVWKSVSWPLTFVGNKLVDGYFSASRVVAEQREYVEDVLAERKFKARAQAQTRSRSRSKSK
jgi:hypothetical protein